MSDRDASGPKTPEQQLLQEELQEEFLKPLDDLQSGQLVEGTVVQVGTEYAFVDIGYKSEGRIRLDEFDEPPTIGDNVSVVLLNKETVQGGINVSKRKADERVSWKQLKDAFQEHEPVEGTVAKSIKGGFEVRLFGGLRAFNPISKMDVHRVEEPEEYVGVKSKFHIERLYSDNRVNIVVSRRGWLEEQVEKNREEFFGNTEIGDVVEGTVKSFTSFGAFIDLGGFDGLLHLNDMSWGHATRPRDYVQKGEVIQLRVIRLDTEEKKINLSLRHMSEDPWNRFEEKYGVDQVVTGKVTKLADFGAFIELEEGIEGLAHISELSWVKHINHPREVLDVGDEVDVMILDYDVTQGRVSLGVKQVQPNPWTELASSYPIGMTLRRPVKKITNSGAFVELEEGVDAFIHADDLSWTKRPKNPSAVLTEGEEVDFIITEIDPETHNIRGGIKQLSDDPWVSLKRAYADRSVVEGEVTNITDFGLFVRVQGGIEGLIHKANLVDSRTESYEKAVEKVNIGDRLQAIITEVNPGKQRLGLSVREVERKERQEELQKYIHDDSAEGTLTLGELLKEKEKS